MARRRRPGPHTSIVDGRARIVVPITSIVDAAGDASSIAEVGRWLRRVDTFPAPLDDADASCALVFDRFAWDLHLGDVAHATDTHDGDDFFDAAIAVGTVAVYVVDGADPRRAGADALVTAAQHGDVVGATVRAFAVDVLDP